MFWDFPYRQAGFSNIEWEQMPASQKRTVRDWYLNESDDWETASYMFLDSDWQVQKIVRKYRLKFRPKVRLVLK